MVRTTGSFGWVDVVAIVFALALAALGAWRGLRREIMVTLAGIVLGVALGPMWANTWGGTEGTDTYGVILLISLLFMVIFLGYGSAFFMRRRPLVWWQHVVGGVIGLFNGLLLVSYIFQYIQVNFVRTPSTLSGSITYTIATEWLSWAFVIIVAGVGLAVAVVALIRFGRFVYRLAQPPAAEVLAAPPTEVLAPEPTLSVPPVSPGLTPEAPPVELEELPGPGEPSVPCPNCGEPVPFGAAYCAHCGKVIS